MRKIASVIFIFFICIMFLDKIFTKYEYEIGEFLVACVNYVKNGEFRSFYLDKEGIPQQFAPRVGIYTSPFYIVQACILYLHRNNTEYSTVIGEVLDGWPQEIPYNFTEKQFENCLNYILSCFRESANKRKHVLYNFDWYDLKKPWFSGLTDAMTVFLFQQLYQKTKDLQYLQLAKELYTNLLKDDCFYTEDGDLYIEEYIGAKDRVFNGWVIATLCILYYENRNLITNGIASALIQSLKRNAPSYDLGWYTAYSLSTHVANRKYHTVNTKCVKALSQLTQDPYWENLFVKWLKYSDISFLKKHFLTLEHFGKLNCRLDIVVIFGYFFLASITIAFILKLILRNNHKPRQ